MKNLTDITLIVDRSGSMNSIAEEATGGINSFIEEQKNVPGEAIFSLVQFDSKYETVLEDVPMSDLGNYKYTLVPGGFTRLFDAICSTIITTRARFDAMKEEDRPDKVIFVIATDGRENSSVEFRDINKVKEMIEHQRTNYNWQFLFLSADEASFAQAYHMGFDTKSVAKVSRSKIRGAYAAAGHSITDYRTGETQETCFDEKQKTDLE